MASEVKQQEGREPVETVKDMKLFFVLYQLHCPEWIDMSDMLDGWINMLGKMRQH